MNDTEAMDMGNPEIIFNLWYVHGDDGLIYSLRARAYVREGGDEEKLRFLQQYAGTDYLLAKPFPVPERYHATVGLWPLRKKMAVMPMQALATQGGPVSVADLFEEAFQALEADMPAQTNLKVPEDPLFCLTPILGHDDGTLEPEFHGKVRLG